MTPIHAVANRLSETQWAIKKKKNIHPKVTGGLAVRKKKGFNEKGMG